MKTLFYILGGAVLVVFATWAYRVNYETQDAVGRVNDLTRQIAREREAIGVLRAEWAYLNRPDRLRELAELYFPDLQLMPLSPEHFGEPVTVAYPIEDLADAIEANMELSE